MTQMIASNSTATFAQLVRLLVGLREFFPATAPAQGAEDNCGELSPRMRYDIGYSDLCPDRHRSATKAQATAALSLEIMRRCF